MFGMPHLQRADCIVQSLDGGTQYMAVRVALEEQSPDRTQTIYLLLPLFVCQ